MTPISLVPTKLDNDAPPRAAEFGHKRPTDGTGSTWIRVIGTADLPPLGRSIRGVDALSDRRALGRPYRAPARRAVVAGSAATRERRRCS